MSTTLAAILLALAGIVAVAGVSWVFYLVGRAEDRDRAEAMRQAAPPEPGRTSTPTATVAWPARGGVRYRRAGPDERQLRLGREAATSSSNPG
jgi:hypothetical protein